jgi:hypothetical protein
MNVLGVVSLLLASRPALPPDLGPLRNAAKFDPWRSGPRPWLRSRRPGDQIHIPDILQLLGARIHVLGLVPLTLGARILDASQIDDRKLSRGAAKVDPWHHAAVLYLACFLAILEPP